MKIKVIENQGRSHTLTQADKNTFRLYAGQTVVIDGKLLSTDFYAEQAKNNILLVPVESEESKKSKTKNPKEVK